MKNAYNLYQNCSYEYSELLIDIVITVLKQKTHFYISCVNLFFLPSYFASYKTEFLTMKHKVVPLLTLTTPKFPLLILVTSYMTAKTAHLT